MKKIIKCVFAFLILLMFNLIMDDVSAKEEWESIKKNFGEDVKLCGPYYTSKTTEALKDLEEGGSINGGLDIPGGGYALMVVLDNFNQKGYPVISVALDSGDYDATKDNIKFYLNLAKEECPSRVYVKYEGEGVDRHVTFSEQKRDDSVEFKPFSDEYSKTCYYLVDRTGIYVHFFDDNKDYVLVPDCPNDQRTGGISFFQLASAWHTKRAEIVEKKLCPKTFYNDNGDKWITNVSSDSMTCEEAGGNCQTVSPAEDYSEDADVCFYYDLYLNKISEQYEQVEKCGEDKDSICKPKYIYTADKYISQIQDICPLIYHTQNYNDKCVESCLNFNEDLKSLKDKYNIKYTEGACSLSSRIIKFIANILKWVKYIAPVLVIVLGILDFIKAISAQSEDEMKKAQGKFVKRLIAAALLFLLPFIIQFILERFNMANDNPYCNLL